MKNPVPILATGLLSVAAVAQVVTENLKSGGPVVRSAEVPWGALNPARGDKGPRAGGLWNDRTKEESSGFLVRFKDGFESPPHIHNVTYRGVVIRGLVHNDDPDAAEMWMPPGSFWTQPAGEVHITSAKGEDVMAYIEIDSGPYLVLPKEKAFDKGERPVNVDPSNLVWLSASQAGWLEAPEGVKDEALPEMVFLWGEPETGSTSGSFIRLPKGFSGELVCGGKALRVVAVTGSLASIGSEEGEAKGLKPGEYFGLSGSESRVLQSGDDEGCVVYVRADGPYRVEPLKSSDQ